MKDRFIIGFTAGVIGGISAAIISIPLYILKLITLRLMDFAAILVLGKEPRGTFEIIYGFLLHWGFSGILGVFFAYLVNHQIITNKHLWVKGGLFGLGSWFIINVLSTVFRVKKIMVIPVGTATILATASLFVGIVMALVFEWLMKNHKVRQ